jgi:hypothetical protein
MMKTSHLSKSLGSAVVISSLLSLLSLPTQAGSNGQQLQITTTANARKITVTGKNQNGQNATWTRNLSGNGKPLHNITVTTNNWWWVGSASIVVDFNGSTRQCSVNVPRFGGGVRSINCGAFTLPR